MVDLGNNATGNTTAIRHVYSDLGSKQLQPDIETMHKWALQFGDPLDLWRRSEISYHQSRLFVLF